MAEIEIRKNGIIIIDKRIRNTKYCIPSTEYRNDE